MHCLLHEFILGVDVKRSGIGRGGSKAGSFGSMRLKPSMQGQNQIQPVKTLSRSVGMLKMPRVSLCMGVNMNLATWGVGREKKQIAERRAEKW